MSVFHNCCWISPAQFFMGQRPAGLMTIFYCLRFKTPPTWRARSPYLYSQGHGGPVIPPDSSFSFRRLLLLAGLRWRYSNPPPHGITTNWVLYYDRPSVGHIFFGIKYPSGGLCPNIYYCLTVIVIFLWGAVSDERTGLSFVYAAGPW
jgi:hypothetical protein